MTDLKIGEPRSKKRKLSGQNIIRVGDRVLSLDGYFNPPAQKKKPVDESPQKESEVKESETQPPPPQEASGDNQARAYKRHKSRQTSQGETDKSSPRPNAPRSKKDGSSLSRWKEDASLLKTRQKLPIWAQRGEIQDLVRKNDVLILVGETGSGKSTQVPQFLVSEPWCRRKTVKVDKGREAGVGGVIAVTQPRRVAATTLAHRVAREAGTPLRQGAPGMVGYSVRFDHNVPKGTKIKFLTEGMLLQELLHDPCLRQYSAIVVDEIHERSVDVDLLSGFLKQILSGKNLAGRGGIPLKVVVMSATADVERIRGFFSDAESQNGGEGQESFQPEKCEGSAISVGELRIPGRQYPVQTVHLPKAIPDIQEGLLKSIFKIHTEEPLPGDILAFLTGQEEIEAAQGLIEEYSKTLASDVPKIRVFPLFGQLSIEAQHEARGCG